MKCDMRNKENNVWKCGVKKDSDYNLNEILYQLDTISHNYSKIIKNYKNK